MVWPQTLMSTYSCAFVVGAWAVLGTLFWDEENCNGGHHPQIVSWFKSGVVGRGVFASICNQVIALVPTVSEKYRALARLDSDGATELLAAQPFQITTGWDPYGGKLGSISNPLWLLLLMEHEGGHEGHEGAIQSPGSVICDSAGPLHMCRGKGGLKGPLSLFWPWECRSEAALPSLQKGSQHLFQGNVLC